MENPWPGKPEKKDHINTQSLDKETLPQKCELLLDVHVYTGRIKHLVKHKSDMIVQKG